MPKSARSTRRPVAKAAVSAPPATRRMSVIAQDPTVTRPDGRIVMASIEVPAEDLIPGPVGYRVQVVDYDASSGKYHGAHELPAIGAKEPADWVAGDPGIVGDFRFHAQNVYALVMKTLARFEFALGRRIGWSFDVHQLKVAPHGMMDANAFYSPNEEGLVLGYFPGRRKNTVYTCLSQDIVVHETAHALIDALRERYMDPSGPDQAAFHEGLSDVIALLSIYTQGELVEELLMRAASRSRTTGLIADEDVSAKALAKSALFGLAEQLGDEIQEVRGDALRRSVELGADPALLDDPEYLEPHRRGEILAAAVMKAFLTAWTARLAAAKVPGQKQHAVRRVAEEGADIAAALVTMWIRALDYMPPVHLTFADALTAAITADLEVRHDDSRCELRKHMLAAFKEFGIVPISTAGTALGWAPAPPDLRYERVRFESMRSDPDEVFRFIWENRQALDIAPDAFTKVLSVRPCVRQGLDGFTLHETIAEYYQVARLTAKELGDKGIALPDAYVHALDQERAAAKARRLKALKLDGDGAGLDDDEDPTTPVYGGGVLIFDEYGKLKYHVHNDVFGSLQAERLRYLWDIGQLRASRTGAQLTAARLSQLHRQRAMSTRRFFEQGW